MKIRNLNKERIKYCKKWGYGCSQLNNNHPWQIYPKCASSHESDSQKKKWWTERSISGTETSLASSSLLPPSVSLVTPLCFVIHFSQDARRYGLNKCQQDAAVTGEDIDKHLFTAAKNNSRMVDTDCTGEDKQATSDWRSSVATDVPPSSRQTANESQQKRLHQRTRLSPDRQALVSHSMDIIFIFSSLNRDTRGQYCEYIYMEEYF